MRCPSWLVTSGYWLILAAWTCLIFWLSSRTSEEIPTLFENVWDKLLHVVAFGLLTLFFLLASNRGFRHPVRPALLVTAVLFSLLYGVIDEWHQSMVATRVASAADLLADGVGSVAALPFYTWIARVIQDRGDGNRPC